MQVGSGARTVGKRLGRRDEGFAGFGVPLVSHGAVGGEAGGVHGAPPPHPEFGVSASQAVRGVCVCVCLGVGGVPHQLYGGGRVRVRDLRAHAKIK